jgi:type VI protein secretion system component Hcp
MAFDAFMVIKVRGKEILPGESTDATFPRACEILQFRFTSSDSASQIQESIEGTDAASSTDSATDSASVETPATETRSTRPTPVKDAKDIAGLNGSLKTLEKRVADHEEKYEEDLKRLRNQTKKLSSATKAQSNWLKGAKKKLDRLAGSEVAVERSSGTDAVASQQTSDPKVAAPKRLSVTLSKYLDSASPGLLKAYCIAADPKEGADASAFDSVHLMFRKAGGSNPLLYLKLNLYKVDVTAYSLESNSGTEPPAENLTLSFESFKVEYTAQSAAGTTSAKSKTKIMGWDFEKNSAEVDAGLPAGFGLFD